MKTWILLVGLVVLSGFVMGQNLIFKLEGTVTDISSREPIDSLLIELVNLDSGQIVSTFTDSNGFYKFESDTAGKRLFLPNSDYQIDIRGQYRKGDGVCRYFDARGQESTTGITESTAFIKDFQLQSSNCCDLEPFFPIVYFNDCSTFQQTEEINSLDSLGFVLQTMLDNPTIIIEVAAHSFGKTSSIENIACSKDRAEAVVEYLAGKGISKERLVPVGYGQGHPKFSKSELEQMSAERQAYANKRNNRVVFSVLSFDYMPE